MKILKRIKKGFTLIELLAVIVILAVIAVIATPLVLNTIERARIGSLKDSTYSYMQAIEYYIASTYSDDDPTNDFPLNGTFNHVDLVAVKGTKPTGVNVVVASGKVVSGAVSFNDDAVIINNGAVSDITKSKVSISLIGSSTIDQPFGTSYNDSGATAFDLIDGDITGSITKSGTVDVNKIGTYKITYNVINSSGIAASVERTINVIDQTSPVITVIGITHLHIMQVPFIQI